MKMKVFNYSELHFSEVTSYKLHTLSEDPISPNRTALKLKFFYLLPLTLVSLHSLKSGGILIIGQKQDSLDSSDKVIQKNRSFPNLNLDVFAYVSGLLVRLI